MTHDGDDGPRKHRPLPSVDMALLPHELRALRVRQVTLVLLGIFLTGAALCLSVARPWVTALLQHREGTGRDAQETSIASAHAIAAAGGAGHAAPEPQTEPIDVRAQPATTAAVAAGPIVKPQPPAVVVALTPVPGAPPGIARSTRAFGQARGFRDALVSAGVSGADADALVGALDKLVDFRHAQPDDELMFERDSTGQLVAFEYRASITERFRAERKPEGGFKGARIKVDIEHRRIARGGFIADSLGKALEALGIRSNVAGAFVEAFEGRIDFKKHSRQGDSFKLILDEDYVDGQSLGYGRLHALQYKGERAGEAIAVWFEPDEDAGDFYDESGRAMHGGWLRTPLRYDHISSGYDLKRKHPILHRIMPHEGIDYAAAPGTTVWAAADGVVTFAGPRGANGNLIALQHAGGYETFYAHLLRMAPGIKRGAKVSQRQPIGQVGSTGRSTGPHLHFALKRNGGFLDPAKQLNGPGKPLPDALMPKFKRVVTQLKHELAAIALAPAPAPSGDAADTSDDFHEETIDL